MDLFTKIKSITSFTESEQIFIQYILDHPYDVIQLSLQQLAKTSYYFNDLPRHGKTRY